MAGLQIHTNPAFNNVAWLKMGQVFNTVAAIETNVLQAKQNEITLFSEQGMDDDEACGFTEKGNEIMLPFVSQPSEILCHDRQEDEPGKNELCSGEVLDDAAVPQSINDLPQSLIVSKRQCIENNQHLAMEWSEKKRRFSLSKAQTDGSFNSDFSSESRQSFSSYLLARECDAEEILWRLGFGSQGSTNVPARFFSESSSVSPRTSCAFTDNIFGSCADVDRHDLDEESSRTSFESSWSTSSFDKLPSRFLSSLSRVSSISSLLSDAEESDENSSCIPSIIEPEKELNDGFDLMRHLRLNRVHQEKGLLEPVSEELEVSSIGSGSARTKVCANQDSFDSVGNLSIVTAISQSEEKASTINKDIEAATSLISNINSSDMICDKPKQSLAQQTHRSDQNHDENLALPSMNNSFFRFTQESFELEEIATSEENIDKIENKTSRLKREHSDDSSGFGDDSAESSKKSPYKQKPNCSHLLVPGELSTSKTSAESKRSRFAKRHSWSATKQKRVVCEDEAFQRCRSCEEFRPDIPRSVCDEDGSPYFDISAVDYSEVPKTTENVANSLELKSTSQPVESSSNEENELLDQKPITKSSSILKPPFAESTTVRNLKSSLYNRLLSFGSKIKKASLLKSGSVENPESIRNDRKPGSPLVGNSQRKIEDKGKPPIITVTSFQKSSPKEFSQFENDLQNYRSTFQAMDAISTCQEKYYTRKLQARFAWDIVLTQKLRAHINDELTEMTSNLSYAKRIPNGVQSQMKTLLEMQSGLQENLLTFNKAAKPNAKSFQTQPSQKVLQTICTETSIGDIEAKIRDSVVDEVNYKFHAKINELREEMKAKDSLIEKLLKRLPEIEQI